MRFRDKVVWVTGASSGIGEAVAVAFSREGAKLILSSRNAAAVSYTHLTLPTIYSV